MTISNIVPELITPIVKDFILDVDSNKLLSQEKIQKVILFENSAFFDLYKDKWGAFKVFREKINKSFSEPGWVEIIDDAMTVTIAFPWNIDFELKSLIKLYLEISIGYELVEINIYSTVLNHRNHPHSDYAPYYELKLTRIN